MIYKSWPSYVKSNWFPFIDKDVTIFFTQESKLLKECEALIEEVGLFEQKNDFHPLLENVDL
jgi:hypothetical protein